MEMKVETIKARILNNIEPHTDRETGVVFRKDMKKYLGKVCTFRSVQYSDGSVYYYLSSCEDGTATYSWSFINKWLDFNYAKKETKPKFVKCIKDGGYCRLTVGKVYEVLDETSAYYRIIGDDGEGVYFKQRFEVYKPKFDHLEETAADKVRMEVVNNETRVYFEKDVSATTAICKPGDEFDPYIGLAIATLRNTYTPKEIEDILARTTYTGVQPKKEKPKNELVDAIHNVEAVAGDLGSLIIFNDESGYVIDCNGETVFRFGSIKQYIKETNARIAPRNPCA